MTDMHMRDGWEDRILLIDHLAAQLVAGRLGLFLGAGISQFYGLPDWKTLVTKLCVKNGETLEPGDDVIAKAGYLRATSYKGDEARFNKELSAVLYEGVTLDFARLRQNATLAAIGSLVMSSTRGSAGKVFTLNYDDLLENYLEYHGFTTAVVWSDKHWAHNEDVTIYHPHGFLPLAPRPSSDHVVLGSSDYQRIMQSDLWKPLLRTAMRTHTFIHIGLSGTDLHLQHLLHGLGEQHAIADDRVAYHSVRFALAGKKDEVGPVLEPQGVFTHELDSYDELPDFLFAICQAARLLRMR
jgi:hypothetical protein